MEERFETGEHVVDAREIHGRSSIARAENAVQNRRDEPRDASGGSHKLDVVPDVDAEHGRLHQGCIGYGREAVAEVSAGDDRAGHNAGGKAEAETNAHHSDADGGDGTPRRAGGQCDDGCKDERNEKKSARGDDLQSPVNQGGDGTGAEPDGDHAADGNQQSNDADGGLDEIESEFLGLMHAVAEIESERDKNEPGKDHHNDDGRLADREHQSNKRDENKDREDGEAERSLFLLSGLFGRTHGTEPLFSFFFAGQADYPEFLWLRRRRRSPFFYHN